MEIVNLRDILVISRQTARGHRTGEAMLRRAVALLLDHIWYSRSPVTSILSLFWGEFSTGRLLYFPRVLYTYEKLRPVSRLR